MTEAHNNKLEARSGYFRYLRRREQSGVTHADSCRILRLPAMPGNLELPNRLPSRLARQTEEGDSVLSPFPQHLRRIWVRSLTVPANHQNQMFGPPGGYFYHALGGVSVGRLFAWSEDLVKGSGTWLRPRFPSFKLRGARSALPAKTLREGWRLS